MTPNAQEGQVAFAGRLLVLNSRAFCLAESATGINVPVEAVRAEVAGGMSFRLVHAILFGALAAAEPGTSPDDVHGLIDSEGFNACALAAGQLLQLALPMQSPGERKSQPESPDSTG